MDNKNEMFFRKKRNSATLFKTEVNVEGKGNLVIAAGYNKENKFGYFITYEDVVSEPGWFVYTDTICFVERINETTFKEAVNLVKEIVEASTTKQ